MYAQLDHKWRQIHTNNLSFHRQLFTWMWIFLWEIHAQACVLRHSNISDCAHFQEALEALFRAVDVAKRAVNATYAYVHPDLWDKQTQYQTRDISIDGQDGYKNPEGRRAKAAKARLEEVETDYSE